VAIGKFKGKVGDVKNAAGGARMLHWKKSINHVKSSMKQFLQSRALASQSPI
jgi:hypothetical protein